jgi:DNA-binding IclR family transcriptional regulator
MQPEKRQLLLDTLLLSENGNLEKYDQMTIQRELKTVKENGYAVNIRTRRYTDQTAISVPIINADSQIKGALTVRYSTTAYEINEAIKLFVPSLNDACAEIASRIDLHIKRQANAFSSANKI